MEQSTIRTDLRYDPETLYWVDVQGNTARVGMSPLVQESTGSFVAVQFSGPGTMVNRSGSFGSTEAEKHVGQLKAPVSGKLLRFNESVVENPRLLNTDPYGAGWLAEFDMSNAGEELPLLVQGAENVLAFFEAEEQRYKNKGWLAEDAAGSVNVNLN